MSESDVAVAEVTVWEALDARTAVAAWGTVAHAIQAARIMKAIYG